MPSDAQDLTPEEHNGSKRDFELVYPVLSRRAGGLSIGVNLSPGHECNWACLYCEVEGLVRGAPKPVDLVLLEKELDTVISQALGGRWGPVPADPRHAIQDVCIAGNGEPTLSPSLQGAIEVAARVQRRHGLAESCRLVVITNGSRLTLDPSLAAMESLNRAGGEIWFKLDAGSAEGRFTLNQTRGTNQQLIAALALVSPRVPTWIQTMAVHPHSDPRGVAARVQEALAGGAQLLGILLYGLRRPSHQPGAAALRALTPDELEDAAEVLRTGTGLEVRVFP